MTTYILDEQIKAIRRTSTPLCAIHTPDNNATTRSLEDSVTTRQKFPLIKWDVVQGMVGINEQGRSLCDSLRPPPPRGQTGSSNRAFATNPVECLQAAMNFPNRAALVMHNVHMLFGTPGVVQGIANLRDPFKANGRTLFILGNTFTLPIELQHDVTLLDEPMPDASALEAIVKQQYVNAGIEEEPDADTLLRSVDALRGLAAYPAEQETAMVMREAGVDVDALWERKRKVIEQAPGLSVWRGGATYADVGGYVAIQRFMKLVLAGKDYPRACVWMDEIEKMFAGVGGDLTGISDDYLGTMLTHMQETETPGIIFIGPPGTGKSFVAKTTGGEAGIPTIRFDMGAMRAGIVGQSQAQFRNGLKIVDSISDGRALFIATCNNLDSVPPELRRRFKLGIWFFDLPDDLERIDIMNLYRDKYELTDLAPDDYPDDYGWTGDEINRCMQLSWRLGITPKEAAEYIVPVAVSAQREIGNLRELANGRFLSASKGGVYRSSNSETSLHGRQFYTE